MATNFERLKEVGDSPDVVAKAVLKSVTSKNPSLRYFAGKDFAGKDVETWMEAKRSMSDENGKANSDEVERSEKRDSEQRRFQRRCIQIHHCRYYRHRIVRHIVDEWKKDLQVLSAKP